MRRREFIGLLATNCGMSYRRDPAHELRQTNPLGQGPTSCTPSKTLTCFVMSEDLRRTDDQFTVVDTTQKRSCRWVSLTSYSVVGNARKITGISLIDTNKETRPRVTPIKRF